MEDELGTDVDLFAVFFLMGCADSSGEKKNCMGRPQAQES
jgi:hypothetical protein